MKRFLALWLIVSMFAANIAFAPHSQPAPHITTILVLKINGAIDGQLLANWTEYIQSHPSVAIATNYLIIDINSSGGYYLDSLDMASTLKRVQALGTNVYVFAEQKCTSGCFLLASFANSIYATRETKIGFNHNVSDVQSILPQIEAILYANGRIKMDGITTRPLLNREYQPCAKMADSKLGFSDNAFVDLCFGSLNIMLTWLRGVNNLGANYRIFNATLEANPKLGSA